ncbi:hypothetical protein EYS14_03440 [Alteromonadaceae bacterium M269]|nr:hypothetical protein EYS14_03440 [Alteromonadaceae bacterium M269]
MKYTKLFQQIEHHEGRRYEPYKCSRGYWTIGVGRNLDTTGLSKQESIEIFGEIVPKSEYVSRLKAKPLNDNQIDMLLREDVSTAEDGCYSLVMMGVLNDARKAVLINMAFQMGINGLSKFTNTLVYISLEQYEQASEEMLDSKWHREDSPTRALEMSEQMKTGEWQ